MKTHRRRHRPKAEANPARGNQQGAKQPAINAPTTSPNPPQQLNHRIDSDTLGHVNTLSLRFRSFGDALFFGKASEGFNLFHRHPITFFVCFLSPASLKTQRAPSFFGAFPEQISTFQCDPRFVAADLRDAGVRLFVLIDPAGTTS
jgi:hypothetical protein